MDRLRDLVADKGEVVGGLRFDALFEAPAG